MKKSMLAATAAIVLLSEMAHAQQLTDGTDGYSVIYVPSDLKKNPGKISSDSGCYVGAAYIATPDTMKGPSGEFEAAEATWRAMMEQANETVRKNICPMIQQTV